MNTNRLYALGLFSMISMAAFACSDDDGDGPMGTAGTAGTTSAGSGGSSAGTDSGGSGGMGGSAVAGSAGMGGNNGGTGGMGMDSGTACSGCMRLVVPMTAENESANAQVSLAAPVDMSDTVISFRTRINSFDGNAGGIQVYAQNNFGPDNFPYHGFNTVYVNLSGLTVGEWTDVTLDLSVLRGAIDADAGAPDADAGAPDPDAGPSELEPDQPGFDKAQVSILGFQVTAGSAFEGAMFGTAEIDIDTISFSDSATSDIEFSDDLAGFTLNGTPVAGSTLTYVAE